MWHDRTGRGVRVAVVDSGIHPTHPHVGGRVDGGCLVADDDAPGGDWLDRLGHGTAVAAAILEKAPDATLYAVKVFDGALSTSAARVARAIRVAADAGADVINLSLGTPRQEQAALLEAAVDYAAARGAVLVSAEESDGVTWLPGSLPEVIGVRLDWSCPRDRCRVEHGPARDGVVTSGYARPIPGVPLDANLKGISFAVAAVSGFVTRVREALPGAGAAAILTELARRSTKSQCFSSIS